MYLIYLFVTPCYCIVSTLYISNEHSYTLRKNWQTEYIYIMFYIYIYILCLHKRVIYYIIIYISSFWPHSICPDFKSLPNLLKCSPYVHQWFQSFFVFNLVVRLKIATNPKLLKSCFLLFWEKQLLCAHELVLGSLGK